MGGALEALEPLFKRRKCHTLIDMFVGYLRCICPKFVEQQLALLDMIHRAPITSGCHDVELPILKFIFSPNLLDTGTVWIIVFETSFPNLFPFGSVDSPRCSCGVTHETVSYSFLDCLLYAVE